MLKKIMQYVVPVALFIAGTAFDTSAQAQDCTSGRNERMFDLGVRKGVSLARMTTGAFVCPDDPDDAEDAVELFRLRVTNVVNSVTPAPGSSPSDAATCHFLGTVEGFFDELDAFLSSLGGEGRCLEVCVLEGSFVGELAAQLFCDLSAAVGGLELDEFFDRLVTTTCGDLFEEECDTTFEDFAVSTCEEFTVNDPLDEDDDTEEVFLEAKNNQCAYNPAPPEDP